MPMISFVVRVWGKSLHLIDEEIARWRILLEYSYSSAAFDAAAIDTVRDVHNV